MQRRRVRREYTKRSELLRRASLYAGCTPVDVIGRAGKIICATDGEIKAGCERESGALHDVEAWKEHGRWTKKPRRE